MHRICPVCQAENRPSARYCRKCATALPADDASYAPTEILIPPELDAKPSSEPVVQPTQAVGLHETGRASHSSNYRVIIGFVMASLVLTGAFWWKQRAQTAPTPSAADVATRTASDTTKTPSPAPASPPSTSAGAAPAMAAAPATTPASPTHPAAKSRTPQPRAPVPARAASAPAPTPTPAAAPLAPAPVAPTAKPPAAPAPPASPAQACSGRGFLTLTMCINDQCGTPQFTNHPQCVRLREEARRQEEERRLGGN